MLAFAEYKNKLFYLNWMTSERGPLISDYGEVDIDNYENNLGLLTKIFSDVKNKTNKEESIITYSIDRDKLLFSIDYFDPMNPSLYDWYNSQSDDQIIGKNLDSYHYPITNKKNKLLTISVPKNIRLQLKENVRILKKRLNNLSVGIFSAEIGARVWFNAEKLKNYIIWKLGTRNNDEILYIDNKKLVSYFSISRTKKSVKLNWQYGDGASASMILESINSKINNKRYDKKIDKIFIYTCCGKINEIKEIEKEYKSDTLLLNPLCILESTNGKKFKKEEIYKTLALAETGNSFINIDV